MKFHIITIFPEAFTSFLETSIIWKAREKWLIDVQLYKLNEFAKDTSGHVDDKAFGMHGQVLSPIPLARAIEHIFELTGKIPVIYMSPSWEPLKQETSEKLSSELEQCIIICGHYEWIDERIIDLFVNYEISIWEYILTGGEIAAQVLIDSLIRLKPDVLWSSISHEEESFSKKLDRQKEYPVYTRPQDFRGKKVPDILTSGNHKKIDIWKKDNLR
jgi:tRNA (guanine37-N1)-methyltransferase